MTASLVGGLVFVRAFILFHDYQHGALLRGSRFAKALFAVYGLVLSVIFPAIFVVYAREGTFASCFRLREVFNIIGKNAGPFFTAWGISIVASLVVRLVVGFVPRWSSISFPVSAGLKGSSLRTVRHQSQ